MDMTVQQSSVDKQCLEIAKKEILLENDRLLQKIMSQDVLLTVINSMSWNNDSVNEVFQNDDSCVNQNAVEIEEYFKINDLKAQLQDKDKTIYKLKATIKSLRENTKEENVNPDKCDLEPINKELENSEAKLLSENERKEIIENVVHTPFATTIASGMFKLDLEPFPPSELDFACKYATRIQELLVYVQDTCPNMIIPIAKKVTVKPIKNVKKVRFAEPLTSSSNIKQQPVQDLALSVDNVFQANNYDAFDTDVNEAPTAQTMFMANLSSADPVYDEAGPSYDLDILSEVHDHDHYQDAICEHHEEHEIHDDVQPNYVVDSHADYTSDSNMIPYDQYVKDNAVPVVQSNVSSVPNDAYMMIYNDMYEPHAQSVSKTTQNTVVDNSLTAELATYKEQVELYERRARFELTEREQKIDEQLRIVITDRNIKEENLKKELHSVKLQLASTINHNKSMVEEVTSLKKDFKQKENKYLEEFLDMKALKEKVKDKLYKQDQSLQTVHMLCKPKPYYDELNKVAIGYKNPLSLTRAKQV
ncbi:hypothetical protein Tco_1069127 [Tanacetum coccineum]|uniref:Uncharacterized protein n=1 Tax=Tanacetum coccineum TaxID=301880 RepID=A0ABQ5HHL9_9ASTR